MQLVIDSKFRPFSYDELIKPLMQYKETYDKLETDYSNLAAQAELWKDVANQQQNPEAYAIYSKYAKDLDTMAESLSKGMLIGDRAKFTNLKRRYASEIGAIAKADEEVKKADELRLKVGPDAIFQNNSYKLDDALHGKKINNNYQSRDAITKRTAAMTEAAMVSAMKDPEFQKAMGDQYWMLTQHTGGSYEDLKAAIANNAQAQNRFAEIKAQVMKDAGYDRYDAMGKQAIEDAINTGLYAGLDKPARSFQANQAYLNPLQAEQLSQAKTEFNWKKQARESLSLGDPNASSKGKSGNKNSPSSKSTKKANRLAKPIKVKIGGGNNVEEYGDDVSPSGTRVAFTDLTGQAREIAKQYMNDDTSEGYDIYIEEPGMLHGHQRMVIIPREVETIDSQDEGGENDI